jgi:transposase
MPRTRANHRIRTRLRQGGIPHTPRWFSALKQCRAIATRYDKTREPYEAALTIAALLMWI